MLNDVDTFFNANDFAEQATFTPSGGGSSSILVIFDEAYALTKVGDVEFQSTQPVAICKSADVLAAGKGATIVIRTVTYYVMEPQPDGTGITRLILSLNPVQ